MATDLAKLVVSLEAETARYQKELEKARGQLTRFEKASKEAVLEIAQATGVAIAGAATGFALMTKQAIDSADDMSKFSRSVGLSTEALSEFQYAAGLSGLASTDFQGGVVKLTKKIGEVAAGSKLAAAAFKLLGVSVFDGVGKVRDTESILVDVAEAFSQFEDGPEKAALAMEVFGKSGTKMLPFLDSGRAGLAELRKEAAQFGLTVDTEAAKAAELFNDNLSRLGAVGQGVANQFAHELLPVLASLTSESVEFAKSSSAVESVATGLRIAFETVAVVGANVAFVFRGVGTEIGGIAAQVGVLLDAQTTALSKMARFDFTGAGQALVSAGNQIRTIHTEMQADADAARKSLDEFERRILGAHDAAEKVRGTMTKWSDAIKTSKTGTLEQQRTTMLGLANAYKAGEFGAVGTAEATQGYERAIQMALPAIARKRVSLTGLGETAGATGSKIKTLTDALQMQAATLGMSSKEVELYKMRMAGATQAQLKTASELLTGIEAYEKQQTALENGKRTAEGLRTPFENLTARYGELDDLLSRGAISQDTFNRGVIEAQNTFIQTDPAIQKLIDGYKKLQELLADTPTAQLEKQRDLMADLAARYQRNEFGIAGSAEAVRSYSEVVQTALGTLPQKVEETNGVLDELTKEAARNMQGALADFFFDPFDSDLEGMVDNFAKALQRMAAEAAAQQVMKSLYLGLNNVGGGGGGSGSGMLGTLFGAALNYFSGTQAPAPVSEASFAPIEGRAKGGMMRANEPYWTGEIGPELVFPGSTSRILSAKDSDEFMRGRQGGNTTQIFNIETPDPNAFRASERQITRRARMGLGG